MNLENQQTIAEWARTTFGDGATTLNIATRMNCEVSELLNGFAALAGEMSETLRRHLLLECADTYIMLAQIAERLGTDLHAVVDHKMMINRMRVWVCDPVTGKCQHDPERFLDVASGTVREMGKWYVVSDSGGTYCAEGFPSVREALEWCANPASGLQLIGDCVPYVPAFISSEEGWNEDIDNAVIILKGGDIYNFHTDWSRVWTDPQAVFSGKAEIK